MSAPFEASEPLVLPTDPAAIAALFLAERAARLAEREARAAAEARAERAEAAAAEAKSEAAEAKSEASNARTAASASEAMIAHLKLQIEKLKRELYGQGSEKTARLIDQMELQLEELEAKATEDEIAAANAARTASLPPPAPRRRPSRKPSPSTCRASASWCRRRPRANAAVRSSSRSWARTSLNAGGRTALLKVIQTVREKFTCRQCETITQPPAPFHVTPRGFVGPNLLAMILFEKFGQHQPLNRQSERYGREGIDLSVSTLADQVGAATAALAPLHA